MDFEEFIKWLSVNLIEFKSFKTLGDRKCFYAKYDQQNGSITIRNSRFQLRAQKNPKFEGYQLKHNAIKKIFERFNNASESEKYMPMYYELPPSKEKYKKGEYNREYWPKAPDKIATPATIANNNSINRKLIN
jgi:hypothetical protein